MKPSDPLRHAFQKPLYAMVRVTPGGFEINDAIYPDLRGQITRMGLTRKFFHEGTLACSSPDGVRAMDGTLCASCLDPRCQPRLRVHLAMDKITYVLDLASTSAAKLFHIEDEARAERLELADCLLRLTVESRGHWGEVTFERLPHPRELKQAHENPDPPSA